MSEMIERVAREMWERHRERCLAVVPHLGHWDQECREVREDWRAMARVAIETMREPTHEMVQSSHGWGLFHHKRRWQAMIDEALKP